MFIVLLSGCLSIGGQPGSTTAGTQSESTAADGTPSSNRELTPRPVPGIPENLTAETAVRFVENYHESRTWNSMLGNRTLYLSVGVEGTLVNKTGSGNIVRIEGSFSRTFRHESGQKRYADGGIRYVYFVNDSTVMRARDDDPEKPGPDPRNGTVVEEE